jgi:hypothetical protein
VAVAVPSRLSGGVAYVNSTPMSRLHTVSITQMLHAVMAAPERSAAQGVSAILSRHTARQQITSAG